jgi:uncharacterized YigZ family protein
MANPSADALSTNHYPIPAQEARIETRVINSRFIATAGPALSISAAKDFISRIRDEFNDATHNVPAYLIGHGHSVTAHCSDDGEPSGTAGPPALAVLKGSGLGDVVVVVTRYFGGTKLGTGGLVRAYSDAVREVLAALPHAVKVPTHTLLIKMPYSAFEPIRHMAAHHQCRILDETFAAEVTMTVQLPQDKFPAFQNALREISAGKIEAEIIESDAATIMPLAAPA